MIARTCFAGFAAFVAAISPCGHANAQGSGAVVGGESLEPFWQKCRTRRADVLCIGDSNQLHRGAGWDDALTVVYSGEFGLYATGLHPLGENQGQGAGIGSGSSTLNTAGATGVTYSGAPAPASEYLDSEDSDLAPHDYIAVAAGEILPGTVVSGIALAPTTPLDISGALRFHAVYATFDGAGPGSFVPMLRLESTPGQQLARLAPVPTRGADGVASVAIDLPAGARAASVSFRLAAPDAAITGPFVGYYARAENTSRARGVAVHTLYGEGGQSGRDMALALQTASDRTLSLFLARAVALQDGPPTALVRICTGLNDRVEALGSLGPDPQLPGWAPTACADNLVAIITRIEEVWISSGFDVHDIYFVITTSHPVPGEEDARLKLYRAAAEDVARGRDRTASVDLSRLTDAVELEKNGWYVTQGDFNHLRLDGMRALARRELDALLGAAKP